MVVVEALHVARPLLGCDRLPVELVDAVESGGVEAVIVIGIQNFDGISPNSEDGAPLLPGILDDLGRSTAAARRLPVPRRDQDIAMVHHILAYLGIGLAAQLGLRLRVAAVILDAPRPQTYRLS